MHTGHGAAVSLAAISLDCAEPDVLAQFYAALTGGRIVWCTAASAGVRMPNQLLIIAQYVAHYAPPTWPGSAVIHLDFAPIEVGDLGTSVQRALHLGATTSSHQPDPRWHILLDPAGHPFCITTVTSDL